VGKLIVRRLPHPGKGETYQLGDQKKTMSKRNTGNLLLGKKTVSFSSLAEDTRCSGARTIGKSKGKMKGNQKVLKKVKRSGRSRKKSRVAMGGAGIPMEKDH